jgi:glycosyltransferase involved in cell wall biosynthesis
MLPSVSIIVPVYNVEQYIHRCIDSILAQTFTDFECILVDDCSPDNCPAICDEYARKDFRIKVIHKIRNEGLPFARKTGYENSSGVYIQHIDSDDYIESDMIENLYTYARTKDYDMVCHDWYEHRQSGEVLYLKMPPVSNDFVENIKNIILDLGLKGAVWNKFVKRSVYENIEFPKYGFHEDKYISTQVLFFSKEIGYLNSPFYHYMINNNSWVQDPKREWGRIIGEVNNFLKVIDFIKKHYMIGGGGGGGA